MYLFKMFVKLLTDVNGLYILWVSAEMAYNFYNISAGCPMQIDFNLKHCWFMSWNLVKFSNKLIKLNLQNRILV